MCPVGSHNAASTRPGPVHFKFRRGNTVSRHARPPIPPAADNVPGCAPRVLTGPAARRSARVLSPRSAAARWRQVLSLRHPGQCWFIDAAAAYRFGSTRRSARKFGCLESRTFCATGTLLSWVLRPCVESGSISEQRELLSWSGRAVVVECNARRQRQLAAC